MYKCNLCKKKFNPVEGYLVCQECKLRDANIIYRHECHFCTKYFVSLEETPMCKECFLDPKYFQRECYSHQVFAMRLGRKDMYDLTEEEMDNTPDIGDKNWQKIIIRIFG